MAKLNIIDVSRWNSSVNFDKAVKQIDGVVIRAGYRGTGGSLATDPLFLQRIAGAISAGVKRIGVYWWTTQITVAQAEADAAYLIKLLAPYKASINFGVWLDSEAAGLTRQNGANGVAFNKLSADNRTTCGKAFLAAITAAGYKAGVYASDSWFGTKLIMSKLSAYPFWVAKYSTTPPKVVKSYAAWQYTSKGSVDGIGGTVDKSYFYTDLSTGKTATSSAAASATSSAATTYRTVKKGCAGSAVKTLQSALNKLGNKLTVDGKFGNKTHAAVCVFQHQTGLSVDGVAGPKTWSTLKKAVSGELMALLKIGSTGDAVKWLQRRLNIVGSTLSDDGIFGTFTRSAVIKFQRLNDLATDGIVGPKTNAKLIQCAIVTTAVAYASYIVQHKLHYKGKGFIAKGTFAATKALDKPGCSCAHFVSWVLQAVGLLESGIILSHSAAGFGAGEKSLVNADKLIGCVVTYPNAKISAYAAKLKPGDVLVHDSSIGIWIGDGSILTAREGKTITDANKQYINLSVTSGYEWNHDILAVVRAA